MNTQSVVITKSTAKLLKFILKHQNITFCKLQSKFPNLIDMDLILLCLDGYLVCTKSTGKITVFQDGVWTITSEDMFWASPKTEQFIEERFQRRWQWVVPTVISAIALIVSAAAFILSLLPRVTEVRIVP